MEYIYEDTGYQTIGEARAEDRPRERLERLGAEALSDKELIMLLIGLGTRMFPVTAVADSVLALLDRKTEIGANELKLVPGLGTAKASVISAALELGRRRNRKTQPVTIHTCNDLYREVRHYAGREQEHLIVIMMNGACEVIHTCVATVGLVNKTLVHPREVFSEAIAMRAAYICIAHNHPSGNIMPSDEDKAVTSRLKKAGRILGIQVVDHLIITKDSYYSFLEHGIM